MEIPCVSFYKTADSVTQQICYCPYKTQTATTGVNDQHIIQGKLFISDKGKLSVLHCIHE